MELQDEQTDKSSKEEQEIRFNATTQRVVLTPVSSSVEVEDLPDSTVAALHANGSALRNIDIDSEQTNPIIAAPPQPQPQPTRQSQAPGTAKVQKHTPVVVASLLTVVAVGAALVFFVVRPL